MMRHISEYISPPAPISRKSSAELIGRNGGGMAVCGYGLGRPPTEVHEIRANHGSGFFVHDGKSFGRSMWEGVIPAGTSAGRPTRMESPTLLVGGERLSKPQTEVPIMANANSQGEIRPSVPYRPTPEILQGILAELEAAADLTEQLLAHGHDDAILATVRASLGELVSILNGGR